MSATVTSDEALDRAFIDKLLSEFMLSTVNDPSTLSKAGAASVVRLGAPSAVKEPLISVMLYRTMLPLAEEETTTLPSMESQSPKASASL